MSNLPKGLYNVLDEIRRQLSASDMETDSVNYQSSLDGAQITVGARGKTAHAAFDRMEIDDCYHGVTVSAQIKIMRLVAVLAGHP